MRNVLLCTVGRSLLDNLKRAVQSETLELAIDEFYQNRQWPHIAKALLQREPTERLCGAEINSIQELLRRHRAPLQNLVFFVSDTEAGRSVGAILKSYFEQRRDMDVKSVDVKVVEALQDDKPQDFKVHGLRNLVRSIGDEVSRFGGPERILINATGGYKAQIAVAAIMGQALDIPVFYKHERFQQIIDFPPLPVSFDYDLLGRNAALLTDFERGAALHSSEIGTIDEKLRALLVEVEVDGETLYELSAVGQIFLSSFRVRNPRPPKLVEAGDERPEPRRPNHHLPKGCFDFVHKVWREHRWIREVGFLDYSGQKAIKGIGFEVVNRDKEGYSLIGTYHDKDRFGARFGLRLTDESQQALVWAADYLNQLYRES